MKHFIGKTNNNAAVYVDLIYSEVASQIAERPDFLELIRTAVGQITATGKDIIVEHDMGRTIGYDFVVQTKATDTVFYAKKFKEDVFTPFVKNGKPVSTQFLSMALQKDDSGDYWLLDGWIGHARPPRPGDENEKPISREYWQDHAYVLDGQRLQSSSVTKTCPYI